MRETLRINLIPKHIYTRKRHSEFDRYISNVKKRRGEVHEIIAEPAKNTVNTGVYVYFTIYRLGRSLFVLPIIWLVLFIL
jgi:hypothetical protein